MALSGFRAALSRAMPAPPPMHRLRQGDLHAGDALPCDVHDADGRRLLAEGAVLPDEASISRLIDRGAFRDPERLAAPRPGPGGVAADVPAIVLPRVARVRPWTRVAALRDALDAALGTIADGSPDARDALRTVRESGAELQRLCALDPDALLAVPMLLVGGRHGTRHAMSSAIVLEQMLARLGAAPDTRRVAVLAALTMNVGMVALQESLWSHEGSLSPAQRAAVLAHPARGVALLRSAGVDDEAWLGIVAAHHEHADGSGYPAGAAGGPPCAEAVALMVAERWCAMVSPRAYRPGAPPDRALPLLLGRLAAEADPGTVRALADTVGPTPPGTPVRLACGDLGLVFRRTRDPAAPLVLALRSAIGQSFPDGVRRATSEPRLRIDACVPLAELRAAVDPERIWETVEVLEPEGT